MKGKTDPKMTLSHKGRMAVLYAKLAEHNFRQINATHGPGLSKLLWYANGQHMLIIQEYANELGYEVYAPVDRSGSLRTETTLAAIDELTAGK